MAPSTRPKSKPAPEMPLQVQTFDPEKSYPASHRMMVSEYSDECNSIPDIPECWKVPQVEPGRPWTYLVAVLWRLLCVVSIFRPDLEHHWVSKQSTEGWKIQENRTVSRLTNSNTAAGLILTTTAVFITTQPPSSTWNYSQTAANCLCIFSLSHSLMSIWFGTFVIIVYQAMTREWALEVLMSTRLRLCCTLVALALPMCNLFLATLCLLCAIAAVTLTSPLIVLQASAAVEGILWILFCLMTFWNLLKSSFWTVHLPIYIIGLVTPFRWRRPADNTNQGQGSSAV
ncbi:hypothetical protein SCLCIDRAFT_1222367 [Scleroderma citrinum Foug A]|uniref:Uncharacterized protein n=1 Tax=Scleroderma citrinum Foug A TaxID=1036808 RepID=A0A0C3DC07_9AGAM|nr:hypothetical protein SCLCIDRAFT_1222367 [Scleroderma citrinum Foug A]